MDEKLLKIPMEPRHFEIWVRRPFRTFLRKRQWHFAVDAFKDGQILTLRIWHFGPETPARDYIVIFHAMTPNPDIEEYSYERELEEEEAFKTMIYTRRQTPEAAFAFFEDFFLKGIFPGGDGWKKWDDAFTEIDRFRFNTISHSTSPFFSDLVRDQQLHQALEALETGQVNALETLLDEGLDANDYFWVHESSTCTPLLARYFSECKDLSCALDAVKVLALDRMWLRITDEEGLQVFEALSQHCGEPQFLDVWKALLETDRPLFHEAVEQEAWQKGVEAIALDRLSGMDYEKEAQGVSALFCACELSRRLVSGLPWDGIQGLGALAGRRLTRVLLARSPEGDTPELFTAKDIRGRSATGFRGCVLLDFEGLFAVLKPEGQAFSDTRALEAASGPVVDVSQQFTDALGKHLLFARLSEESLIGEDFYHPLHAFVLEDGTQLTAGGLKKQGGCLRLFKRDWGEFRVSPEGVLKRELPASGLTLRDVYGLQPWDEVYYFDPMEIAESNPAAVDAFIEPEWDRWWAAKRPNKRPRGWQSVAHGKDEKARAFFGSLLSRWLESAPPREGPGRAALPHPYADDTAFAAHELEDLPESFAEALGLVWPDEANRDSADAMKSGVRLTKTIQDANAIAKEHGWLISFRKA